ncbi:hypothetical protein predicted by Glimmer/Critica [Helicobacter pylori B8]|uniref:Uncharacterized protein n=1 Tax=Helicobacter pylori (strain B8) TaxID=693745 RepID=D7FG68_HELP3|nr:hypothetical protein predicted by Glimmer/Critica [Helicobacter pylori B8]
MLDHNRRHAFWLLVSIVFFGVLKKLCFYQDLTNLIGI